MTPTCTTVDQADSLAASFVLKSLDMAVGWIVPTDENISRLCGAEVSAELGSQVRHIIHRDWT